MSMRRWIAFSLNKNRSNPIQQVSRNNPPPKKANLLPTMKDDSLTPDQERFMLWLEADDVEGHSIADGEGAVPTEWMAERQSVEELGQILRSHLPGSLEPSSSVGFNESLRKRLAE